MDEKWFYTVRIKGYVWILPGYMDPDDIQAIRVESKRYITKIMCLVAVAKPVYGVDGELRFSGKVGCWRVANVAEYKTNYTGKFVRHKKGDLHIVNVNMDAETYVEIMTERLLLELKRIKKVHLGC